MRLGEGKWRPALTRALSEGSRAERQIYILLRRQEWRCSLCFQFSSVQSLSRVRLFKMVGWHHWLDGHEFEQAPGAGDGHGSLASFRPRGPKESDTTEQLNWTELTNVSPGVLVTRVSILVTTVYWIARSLPNKWNFLNIHDLKGPPFYTETKEIFDSAWIVTGTIRTY